MCYYNGQKVTHAEFIRLKEIEKLVADYGFLNQDLHDGFSFSNIAVLKPVPGQKDFDIVPMEWGFLPADWFGEPIDTREKAITLRSGGLIAGGRKHPPLPFLNAVGEELLLPFKKFKDSALKRRCLVISTGFYEWRHHFPLNKRTGEPLKTPIRIPYYITLKDKPYFFMAGIWKPWTDIETGETIDTVAIVTTAAPEGHLMAKVHNSKKRMPTILNEDLGYAWMFDQLTDKRLTEIALTQYPSEEFTACTIAKDFKSQLEPTKPFVWKDLPMIESVL